MAQIIESIPNISEGRRQDVIEACVDQIRTTPGLHAAELFFRPESQPDGHYLHW